MTEKMFLIKLVEINYMKCAVKYRNAGLLQAQVHLLGNLVVWLSGSICLILYCILLAFYLIRRHRHCYDLSPG